MFVQTATAGFTLGFVVTTIGEVLLLVGVAFAFLNSFRNLALSLGAGLVFCAIGIRLINDPPDQTSLAVGMGLMGLLFFGIGVKSTLDHKRL
jgi:hypothetical protein